MRKIHQLSPQTVAKIAAGEVIERPSYAVKELIENAIDAHATEITIHIEEGGIKKIQVSDNGEGMSQEDLEECWKPHTTSKLSDEESLLGIKSFGFRGEALASLAAISTLTIKSRTSSEPTGNLVEIKDGKLLKGIPVGMPQGTTILAQYLFSKIPARKKFLKSIATEFRHIVDVVSHFAIVYSFIRFTLYHNTKLVYDFTPTSDRRERLTKIFGEKTASFFIPIDNKGSSLSISGFIAKPQMHTTSPSKQLLFVNKRHVSDKMISLAVKEAFGTMLESTSYPLFLLFLDLPHEMVDINVHPRKELVAFYNTQSVFQTVKESLLETLQEHNITFQNISWLRDDIRRTGVGTTHSFAGKLLKETVLDKKTFAVPTTASPVQINHLYIFYQTTDALFLVDQHAAHERILFEKLSKEFIAQKKKSKPVPLKDPVVLHLSTTEQLLIKEQGKLFQKLGFTILSKHNTLVITHVPSLFEDRDPEAFIKQLVEHIEQGIPLKEIDAVSEEMIAFLACRAAVKAGDTLEEKYMRKIITDLETTANNATCPHGRPTRIVMTLEEINNLFGR